MLSRYVEHFCVNRYLIESTGMLKRLIALFVDRPERPSFLLDEAIHYTISRDSDTEQTVQCRYIVIRVWCFFDSIVVSMREEKIHTYRVCLIREAGFRFNRWPFILTLVCLRNVSYSAVDLMRWLALKSRTPAASNRFKNIRGYQKVPPGSAITRTLLSFAD